MIPPGSAAGVVAAVAGVAALLVAAASEVDAPPDFTQGLSLWQLGLTAGTVIAAGVVGYRRLRSTVFRAAEDASTRAIESLQIVADAETTRRHQAETDATTALHKAEVLASEVARLRERTDLSPLIDGLHAKWDSHSKEHEAILRATERLVDRMDEEAHARTELEDRIVRVVEHNARALDRIADRFPAARPDPPRGSAHPFERTGEQQHRDDPG